jgi:hypothetical protein
MSDKDLSYRLPPDVLHYEPKYIFGLSLQDMLVAVVPALLAINAAGIVWGAIVGLVGIAAMKRWDAFGNRSVVVYVALLLWYRFRPGEVSAPRVLPLHPSRVEVSSWEGDTLFVLEGEEQ